MAIYRAVGSVSLAQYIKDAAHSFPFAAFNRLSFEKKMYPLYVRSELNLLLVPCNPVLPVTHVGRWDSSAWEGNPSNSC